MPILTKSKRRRIAKARQKAATKHNMQMAFGLIEPKKMQQKNGLEAKSDGFGIDPIEDDPAE